MKIYIHFEHQEGPLAMALRLILQAHIVSVLEEANLIIADSVQAVLKHLQQDESEKLVVQLAWGIHHPLNHLVEDYPKRFRVVHIENVDGSILEPLCRALAELRDLNGF